MVSENVLQLVDFHGFSTSILVDRGVHETLENDGKWITWKWISVGRLYCITHQLGSVIPRYNMGL